MSKFEKIAVDGFRRLSGLELELRPLSVLIGANGAGKTSLVKRIRGEKFSKSEPQTHGINIHDWGVKVGDKDIDVHFWDFGGQEIMHATHQLFLSKRSLYVLVVDTRKEDNTEYWLKHIKSFGGDSPVLIAINKIDENSIFDLNLGFLQKKYPNIRGFYRLSCKSGQGRRLKVLHSHRGHRERQ